MILLKRSEAWKILRGISLKLFELDELGTVSANPDEPNRALVELCGIPTELKIA